MVKNIIGCLLMVFLTSCMAHNKEYYRNNPQALQAALKQCPKKQPATVSCEELSDIAQDLNRYAYELQLNPQQFGLKILNLQIQLATVNNELRKGNSEPTNLKDKIATSEQELKTRLAVVKWLESPETR
ncbi:hypothetical protein ACNVED_08680 [Legionella sp. D16C41]|uniref:hypothetical protein n=1 Tax=Legionella sp. D16C41 TaxID=3402688 RepID=UPI003AF42648